MNKKYFLAFLTISCAIVAVAFFGSDAFASEGTSAGRKIWDNIMLWVNFLILVFFFLKFGKKPLMSFLHGERKRISKNIEEVENKVKDARALMEKEAVNLEGIEQRLEEIKKNIIEIGRREKESIIERATTTATQMVEGAHQEVQFRLEAAKKRFGQEMLDMAVKMAIEKLLKEVTKEENDRLVEQFSTGLGTAKRLNA